MEPNQISEPFETAFGFHVVKLLEGPVVVKKPFEAVSGDIRYRLRNQAKDAELKRLLGKRE
jgi:peptidyl-prolyl cis-trans isomerase C